MREKIQESLHSVLPIALIVAVLSLTLTPMDPGYFLLFLFGVGCLVLGLSIFTIGAEMSMQPLGEKIGTSLAESGKIWLIAFASFVIGVFVTTSEPDLQILANQVSGVENLVLILAVSVGVGLFLVMAILRIIFKVSLSLMLLIFYGAAVVLCFFVNPGFWAVAFDSGGVTTGPMTVPFIMSIGAGVSTLGASRDGRDDSFGLVALCSIGPILSVMILGILFSLGEGVYEPTVLEKVADTRALLTDWYFHTFLDYIKEVAVALLPIVTFALLFQIITRAFHRKQLIRIGFGILYTFSGLVIFLTGANEGFLPVGQMLGESLAGMLDGWILIPVGMLMGYFIVNAEPAVYVLNKQVEQATAGAVSVRMMRITLSIGVAAALGLSMVRILTGISILWILIPGYLLALGLTFIVPKFFVGIAFDSGGVASGTMMSAFVLPFAIGACMTLRGTESVMTQAFGCVSFVALTPIISIQICGFIFRLKSSRAKNRFVSEQEIFFDYSDDFQTETEPTEKEVRVYAETT